MAFGKASLVFASLMVAAFCIPIPTEKDTREFFEMLPAEIQEFIKSLTDDDIKQLSDLADDLEGKSEDEEIATIKEQSPELAKKLQKAMNAIQSKIDGLPPKAKKFMIEFFDKIIPAGDDMDAYMKDLEDVIEDAQHLSSTDQKAIVKQFPAFEFRSDDDEDDDKDDDDHE